MAKSSDSESEDDIQLQQFLDAADPLLLTNAMFKRQNTERQDIEPDDTKSGQLDIDENVPKSLRYLTEENSENVSDLNFGVEIQRHIWKKLNEIIDQQVEFCDLKTEIDNTGKNKKRVNRKSKVKLLRDASVYVNSYEDFQCDAIMAQKKPNIGRRQLDDKSEVTMAMPDIELFKSVAVSGDDIIAGLDMKHWAKRPEREGKIFNYILKKNGVLHVQQTRKQYKLKRLK